MSHFDDNEDRITGVNIGRGRKPLHLARDDITCKKCGAPCYWQEVVNPQGEIVTRLFENGKPHDCSKAKADDFDVMP